MEEKNNKYRVSHSASTCGTCIFSLWSPGGAQCRSDGKGGALSMTHAAEFGSAHYLRVCDLYVAPANTLTNLGLGATGQSDGD